MEASFILQTFLSGQRQIKKVFIFTKEGLHMKQVNKTEEIDVIGQTSEHSGAKPTVLLAPAMLHDLSSGLSLFRSFR